MEYLKTYYSLEKHLEETVKYNPQFEILNAIWKLNKKNLSTALNNVNQYFPHYSLHDSSHSNTIISNIESFLGEDRIKRLSPTNTWLILMASFTHDLGMVVFQDLIERQWPSDDFQEFLNTLLDWDDDAMKASGETLIKIQKLSKGDISNAINLFENPIDIKNAVTLVVAEYMRRIHHERSSEILKGIDKAFFDVANAFYSDQIPNRLLSLLGDIAYLHGVEFYEILKRLDYESNGIFNDKINPRFIASLLRLGDLLDIDDGRFDTFTNNTFRLPASSLLHKKKHSSIKHFLITPNAIEITADCPDEQVFRLARTWFDWLEKEVEYLNKEWSNISPLDLGGSAPRIPKGKIKVYFEGSNADDDLLNLRFQIANEKIFEILEGGSIYEKAEFTFIRELVQNGLDASKIQLWSEIEKGTYDFAFKTHFQDHLLSHEDILKRIKFPMDVPTEILNSFVINIHVKWQDEAKENLIIEVSDNGTGISKADLIRMTSKVGQSRKKDTQYNEMLKRMPFWMKPTGAFGIGLQSIFLISDNFTVFTKANGEIGKRIQFRSSKKGKYSTAKDDKELTQQGTVVQVIIPKTKFREVFGNSFDIGIISKYDSFTDKWGNIYLHKILQYINSTLYKVGNLTTTIIKDKIELESNELLKTPKLLKVFRDDSEGILCTIYQASERIYFDFFESIIGSNFKLSFDGQDMFSENNTWANYRNNLYVRDIPVDSNTSYYQLMYSRFSWNFMSESSDKILSINREKLIKKYKRDIEETFFESVLKKALPLIVNYLDTGGVSELNKLYKFSPNHFAAIYFKIILTLKANDIKYPNIDKAILSYDLPNSVAIYSNGENVKMADFFDFEELHIPIAYIHSTNAEHRINAINEVLKSCINLKPRDLILYAVNELQFYLLQNYQAFEVRYYDAGTIISLRKNKSNFQSVLIAAGRERFLESFTKGNYLIERAWNYADSKYSNELAVFNNRQSGFENFPTYSNISIISPFTNHQQFLLLKEEISNIVKENSVIAIESVLTDITMKRYVTESLIKWVIDKNPFKEVTRNESTVITAYRNLIVELLLIKN